MEIEKIPLISHGLILEPFHQKHIKGLANSISDGELWKLKETIIPQPHQLKDFFAKAEKGFKNKEELTFTIIDRATQTIVGSTRFRQICDKHKKAIIGPTFIAKSWQRSHVNTESKYLLLSHAFEKWQMNRIEFHCDAINIRSRSAIQRLGAMQEGIIRKHLVMPDGRIRDTIIHSILDDEWMAVKHNLLLKLEHYEYAQTA